MSTRCSKEMFKWFHILKSIAEKKKSQMKGDYTTCIFLTKDDIVQYPEPNQCHNTFDYSQGWAYSVQSKYFFYTYIYIYS